MENCIFVIYCSTLAVTVAAVGNLEVFFPLHHPSHTGIFFLRWGLVGRSAVSGFKRGGGYLATPVGLFSVQLAHPRRAITPGHQKSVTFPAKHAQKSRLPDMKDCVAAVVGSKYRW